MYVQRVEVPVARGTQKHTFRHILAPKGHRLSDNDVFDVIVRGLGSNGESERTCADD
jgi:hypothetical protein